MPAYAVLKAAPGRRWKHYPESRETEVEWLDSIPAGWKLVRLKHVATSQMSSVDKKRSVDEQPVRLCNYTDVYYNEQITDDLGFMHGTASDDEIDRYSLRQRDVLITKDSESWQDIAVPAWVPSHLNGVLCGYHLAHIRPRQRGIDSEYLFRSLQSGAVNHQFRVAATGITRYGLPGHAVENALLPLPQRDEQCKIAGFLARETTRIMALIERKVRLIGLLEEKRAALIVRAVTKGLDPDVPMRKSGMELPAEIPVHWEVVRLGHLVDVGNGSTPNRDKLSYWMGGDYPWLTSARINDGVIRSADELVTPTALRECHLPVVRPGSLLVAITGEGQTRGRVAVLEIESTISQHLAYLTPRGDRLRSDYLRRAFESRYEWLRRESSGAGSTRAALTCGFLKTIELPLPPVSEQQAIAVFIERETSKLDGLAGKIREAIRHLEEYRAALISAAVTGKIDVRPEPA